MASASVCRPLVARRFWPAAAPRAASAFRPSRTLLCAGLRDVHLGGSSAIQPLTTLKVRAEFLAVRGGVRASVPSCLIEGRRRRGDAAEAINGARFGFTVTKKLGNAVTRNRIRRRLKAAIRELAPGRAKPDHDYVVVARAAAFDRAYADIRGDLEKAFEILGRSGHKPSRAPKNQTRKGPP